MAADSIPAAKTDPEDPRLTAAVEGLDENGQPVEISVVTERPLTLYLNSQEIVTMMTIGDFPELLAVGYLANQNMLSMEDRVTGVDYDDELDVVVVRTEAQTDFEEKLKKRTLTSGCAQGTAFGDMMERFDDIALSETASLNKNELVSLLKAVNTVPNLYQKAGAIHGCALWSGGQMLLYMEDVGRHNAVDKIAGYMFLNELQGKDAVMFTTGRLTSEMVIKAVQMEIPILVSRSGFTAWGVDLARKANLTLVGRAKGKRFIALSGLQRLNFDGSEVAV
jgi:FdhD protein